MANAVTVSRIILSLMMVFTSTFSGMFYAFYLLAGFTDMIDGYIARKTGSDSEFGAKLDTAADFIFVIVSLIKILPCTDIPVWIWVWTGVIALIKVMNGVSGFVMYRALIACHTRLNKVTGLLLFLLPLSFEIFDIRYTGAIVCFIATFAAVQEGHLIRTGRGEIA